VTALLPRQNAPTLSDYVGQRAGEKEKKEKGHSFLYTSEGREGEKPGSRPIDPKCTEKNSKEIFFS